MHTRVNLDVTLSHEDAESVRSLLADYASALRDHARRTRSAPVADALWARLERVNAHALNIGRSLYEWREA
jgi:hypothetical protein